MKHNIKQGILLALFMFMFIGTILMVSFSIGIAITSPADREVFILATLLCGALGFPLSALFLYMWKNSKKDKDSKYKDVATFVKMYRRLPMSDVAKRFNVSEKDAEDLVLRAVELGYLKAYIDRSTGDIITPDAIKKSEAVSLHCPHCGAMITGVYLPGDVVECPYCKTKFQVIK